MKKQHTDDIEEKVELDTEDITTSVDEHAEKIINLEEQLKQAKSREQRALADYQNLIRRNQDERSKLVKYAAVSFIENILQPLEHLSMATEQVNDPGLNMVLQQLWLALEQNGLQEISALGKKFDVHTMEVVDKDGEGDVVIKIVKRGYMLNGEVIQHAKVVVGE